MEYEGRIKNLHHIVGRFYDQIDERIKLIEGQLDELRRRTSEIRHKIGNIKSDEQRGKATRFLSAASYPIEHEREYLQVKPVVSGRDELDKVMKSIDELCNPLKLQIVNDRRLFTRDEIEQYGRKTKNLIEQVGSLRFEEDTQNNADGILDNVSSLLVFHTYESRLMVHSNSGSRISQMVKSEDSAGFSLRDHTSQHNQTIRSQRYSRGQKLSPNGSGERAEPSSALDLGPAPESILRYHQESIIEPDMLIVDNFSPLDSGDEDGARDAGDDSWKLITQDLPDVLPTLSRVARNFNTSPTKRRHHQNQSDNNQALTRSDSSRAIDLSSSEPQSSFSNLGLESSDGSAAPPPPPPPPPMPSFPPLDVAATASTVPASTSHSMIPGETDGNPSSVRSALMAEIRSAGSRPKSKRVAHASEELQTISSGQSAPLDSNSSITDLPAKTRDELKPLPASGDPRDSLLASIRQAAGKPAKKANKMRPRERKSAESANDETENLSAAAGGDLMSDLVTKLRARRDGISGSFTSRIPMQQEDLDDKKTVRRDGAELNERIEAASSQRLKAEPLDTVQRRVFTQVSSLIPQLSEGTSESKSDNIIKSSTKRNPHNTLANSSEDGNDFDEDDWNA